MSTKCSLGYKEIIKKNCLHIYLDGMDGLYYIEDENNKVEIPEELAKKWSQDLR